MECTTARENEQSPHSIRHIDFINRWSLIQGVGGVVSLICQ